MNEFGATEAIGTIKAVLTLPMIDGMVPASVTDDDRRPTPGDVFGLHRAFNGRAA